MKALLLLLLSGTLAAGVFVTGKQAGNEQLAPLYILFWQMTGGALVVLIVSRFSSGSSRRLPVWDWQHLQYYLVGGLLGISLPYVLAFIVMRELQVGTVGLLTALSPVITYGIARVLNLEQGHPVKLIGLVLGLIGVTLLVMPNGLSEPGMANDGDWRYTLLGLGIPASLAASNLYRSHYWPPGSDATQLAIGMLSVQGLALLLTNAATGNLDISMLANRDAFLTLALLSLFAGASYLSAFYLLREGGPVYLSQMGYVISVVTMLAGIMLWSESYDSNDLVSMGLIFVGVLITTVIRSMEQSRQAALAGSAQ
ncbi:MAG: DMT family transporter [Candidatus Thiodiazotropha sp.]|jgi:drug/metabolite transporter (DMT)-like permease